MSTAVLTDEQRELQTLAHDFAVAELRPKTAAWDQERSLEDDVFSKLAESGSAESESTWSSQLPPLMPTPSATVN